MINEGIEPTNFLNDLLEILYFMLQKKNIGNFDLIYMPESEQEIIDKISNNININTNNFLAAYFKSIRRIINCFKSNFIFRNVNY